MKISILVGWISLHFSTPVELQPRLQLHAALLQDADLPSLLSKILLNNLLLSYVPNRKLLVGNTKNHKNRTRSSCKWQSHWQDLLDEEQQLVVVLHVEEVLGEVLHVLHHKSTSGCQ